MVSQLILQDTNALETLPSGIFNDLTSLTNLFLQNNNALETLPSGIFNGLTNLEMLWLINNPALETLPGGIFNGLTSLTELNLHNNSLMELPGGIFNGLTSLTTLLLTSNDLTALPGGIFNGLTNLTAVTASGNTNPLPLNVTIQETSQGMAVIQVAQGVPFTSITANLSITGGIFGTTGTDTTTTATIAQGETRSPEFAFTLAAPTTATPMPEATISGSTTTNPTDILNGADGYSGFTLSSIPSVTIQSGICGRTQQVQTAILDVLNTASPIPNPLLTCATVTPAQLNTITDLDLSGDGISSLQGGDFADLGSDTNPFTNLNLSGNTLTTLNDALPPPSLTVLNASNNRLTSLDGPIAPVLQFFPNITSVDFSNNNLTDLPDGLFSGLTALTGANFSGNPVSGVAADLVLTLSVERTTNQNEFIVTLVQGAPVDLTIRVDIQGGNFETMDMDGMITPVRHNRNHSRKGKYRKLPVPYRPKSRRRPNYPHPNQYHNLHPFQRGIRL